MLYGKREGERFDQCFWKMRTKENAARHINGRRLKQRLGAAGTTLPLGHTTANGKRRLGTAGSTFPLGHTNAYGRRIYRWKDLRKLREENLVRYLYKSLYNTKGRVAPAFRVLLCLGAAVPQSVVPLTRHPAVAFPLVTTVIKYQMVVIRSIRNCRR